MNLISAVAVFCLIFNAAHGFTICLKTPAQMTSGNEAEATGKQPEAPSAQQPIILPPISIPGFPPIQLPPLPPPPAGQPLILPPIQIPGYPPIQLPPVSVPQSPSYTSGGSVAYPAPSAYPTPFPIGPAPYPAPFPIGPAPFPAPFPIGPAPYPFLQAPGPALLPPAYPVGVAPVAAPAPKICY